MAQVENVATEKFTEGKMLEAEKEVIESPLSKKFKQGRLPFKPLDSCQTPQGTSPTAGKKRKLSDNESPSAKQLKIGSSKVPVKSPPHECDPEVSSSSEADSSVTPGFQKGSKKVSTIDKFFKRKSDPQDQAEISSTNECIAIDLTDENSSEPADKENEKVAEKTDKIKPDSDVEMADKEEEKASKPAKTDKVDSMEKESEDKENITGSEVESGLNESFVSDASFCENALKTPGKDKAAESGLKTPRPAKEKLQSSAKDSASGSEATPSASGKKRTSISDSKKKERDALRQRVKDERDKEREEKRLQKEKEKEEKEKERLEKKKQKDAEKLAKDKEKQEKKEQREKERLEKLKQKEDEKKMKEKELEAKLEEKKKKDEERKQKEEERKQKEEEKRLKEEEKKKEEEEKMKKAEKKKEMFKGFFIQKAPTSSPPKAKESKNSLFMPFELKPNMRLAPDVRSTLSTDRKQALDQLMEEQETTEMYTKTLKSSSYKPHRSTATWKWNLKDVDDVEVMSHDKETIEKVTHKVKFLLFHENVRPPYYGTWNKPSDKLSPRNPFRQDEALFDYEVDSDDEWEEEEPGESVSSDEEGEEEEPKGDDDEEDEEEGWMVPHGYLSDGEGIEDEDEMDSAKKQDLQKVRQAAWESELKRQAKPLKMVAIGCVWQDADTTAIAAQQLQTLLKYKAVCLSEGPISTSFTGRSADTEVCEEKSNVARPKRKSVPEEAMPDLIRLVHGNPSGIKNLIKEFRMFWKLKTSPEETKPMPDSMGDSPGDKALSQPDVSMEIDEKEEKDKKDTVAEKNDQNDFAISKRQLEMKIPSIAVRERRPDLKKISWYVKEEVLKQYNMEDLKLPNTWEYVCVKAPKWAEEKVTPKVVEETVTAAASNGRNTPNIMQFAQPMSPAALMSLGTPKREQQSKGAPIVMETSQTATPDKEAPIPADQRTILSMFNKKPTSKKASVGDSASNLNIPSGVLSTDKTPDGKLKSPVVKTSVESKNKNDSPPNLNLGSLFSVKPANKPTIPTIVIPDLSPEKVASPKTPVTSKQLGFSVIDTVLTSPELMKASPKSEVKKDIVKGNGSEEEPMEIIELD